MTDQTVFEGVMFDSEPIGLADELSDLDTPVNCFLLTDEEAQPGAVIYFGLPTPVEEIVEIRGEVVACEQDGDEYRIETRVVAVDSAQVALALKTLAGEKAQESGKGEPTWALGVKQTNGTYAVIVNSPAGILTAEQLAKIADLSSRGAGVVKLTHAQRTVLLLQPDQVETAKEELKTVGLDVGVLHRGVRNIRACCGGLCRLNQGTDALTTSKEIDARMYGHGTKFDVKIAVSDCARNCSESYCADIGLLGRGGKYDIVVGGRGAKVPFRAIMLTQDVPSEEVPDLIEKIVQWYESRADERERFHALLERMGMGEINEFDPASALPELNEAGDGIDEAERIKAHLARCHGVRIARQEMNL